MTVNSLVLYILFREHINPTDLEFVREAAPPEPGSVRLGAAIVRPLPTKGTVETWDVASVSGAKIGILAHRSRFDETDKIYEVEFNETF